MAKRSTPKKKQSRSSSSRRYKIFQGNARGKLMSMSDRVLKLSKMGKLKKAVKKSEDKITKVKA